MASFDGFKKTGIDQEVEQDLQDHMSNFGIEPLDGVKHFPVLARRQTLKRFLAHSDLFKMTLEIPGDIAELGVFRGFGLFTWANLLEAYAIGDRTKRVIGFDNWEGFTEFTEHDGDANEASGKVIGGFDPGHYYKELKSAIDIFDKDRFIPWKKRIVLVDGNIEDTVWQFVKDDPGTRFSLVHFDCDLYKPTIEALNALWPKLSRGGIFLFDEYGIPDWPGETQAVDEFMADKPDLKLKTLPWTNSPAAYLIKP